MKPSAEIGGYDFVCWIGQIETDWAKEAIIWLHSKSFNTTVNLNSFLSKGFLIHAKEIDKKENNSLKSYLVLYKKIFTLGIMV